MERKDSDTYLVICLDEEEWVLATRQSFDKEGADTYKATIPASRMPIAVHARDGVDFRPARTAIPSGGTLPKTIPESESKFACKLLDCYSLEEARELMAAAGVDFDQIYYTPIAGRMGDMGPVHYYFNNGPANNVGYYTPSMDVINIFTNGRADATPLHQRCIKWRKEA